MTDETVRGQNLAIIKTLTYLMFAMFAMTTDSVGIIIPEAIRTLKLSLTAAIMGSGTSGTAVTWHNRLETHP